jgi:hypothetical protein
LNDTRALDFVRGDRPDVTPGEPNRAAGRVADTRGLATARVVTTAGAIARAAMIYAHTRGDQLGQNPKSRGVCTRVAA